jgi:hypothetical protein
MLRVHTNDGLTSSFDLEDEKQAEQWLELLKDPKFQASISGLTVSHRGVLYSLSKPQSFRQLMFSAEHVPPEPERKIKGGERIWCFADEVRIGLMVHRAQRAVRVTLTKTGRQRFSPQMR